MTRLQTMLEKASANRKRAGTSGRIRVDGPFVRVDLPSGRVQEIGFRIEGDVYIMESIVLPSRTVQSLKTREVMVKAWERNRVTDLVTFDVDDKLRLVGRIRQLVDTIDQEELEFYIDSLARECDQFEYELTGKDEN